MKRFVIMVLVALCLGVVVRPAHARTTWEAETQGSPVATQFGLWTEPDGRTARLDFLGGHLIGEHTTFVATYRSPWIRHRSPRFDAEFEITNVNELGAGIPMRVELRSRFRGRGWSDWFGFRRILRPGTTWWGGGMGSMGVSTRGAPMQFEWRLEGTITAPTYLRGFASMSTNKG